MDFSKLYTMENEQEKVSAIYDIYHEENRLNRSQSTKVEFVTTAKYIEEVLEPGDKILDLGAGTGVYSLYFAEKGYDVTAVELADRNIQVFRKDILPHMSINLVHGNALDLDFIEDFSMDVVLLFGPLYHLSKKEDRDKCLQEAKRVLKEDGKLFISFINHDFIPYTETGYNPNWFEGDTYNHVSFRIKNFPFVFFKIKECREMLENNGFKIEKEIASDGLSELMAETIDKMNEISFNQYLKYHLLMCEEKEFLGASNHFLYLAVKEI